MYVVIWITCVTLSNVLRLFEFSITIYVIVMRSKNMDSVINYNNFFFPFPFCFIRYRGNGYIGLPSLGLNNDGGVVACGFRVLSIGNGVGQLVVQVLF